MKWLCVVLTLLAQFAGGQAAAGDLGAACKTNDVCTNSNVYCDTSDADNKVCKCYPGWVKSGSQCLPGASQICGHSRCNLGLQCRYRICTCNHTVGYASGLVGSATCSCPAGKTLRASDNKCAKVIGQNCTTSGECIDNAVCDGTTNKCKCDTSKNFAAGSDDDTSCSCDETKAVDQGGVCKLKTTKTCNAEADCMAGLLCTGGKCVCDADKGFADATTVSDTCLCADPNKAADITGTCRLKVGEACDADKPCMTTLGMMCASETSTCTCDTANGFAAGNAGDDRCSCDSAKARMENGVCKFKAGETCYDSLQCISTMICANSKCACNITKGFAVAANGATSCLCLDINKAEDAATGECKLKHSQSCEKNSDCLTSQGMVCVNSKCTCDPSNGFSAGSSYETTCTCSGGNKQFTVGKVKYCGGKIGWPCKAPDSKDVCTDNASCKAEDELYTCQCEHGSNEDGSCKSGVAGALASMAVMMVTLTISCRLI